MVCLLHISRRLQILIILFIVVIDIVFELQEYGHGHARRLLLYLTIKTK